MTPFATLTSLAAPLLRDNVDTDTIIPSREIRSTGKIGLADGLFAPWRYIDAQARTPNPAFALNDPAFTGAQIIASGQNFGCGSSREHAVWALAEYGTRCVIAESFAPIFAANCVRNGVLPLALEKADIAKLAGEKITVDLSQQEVRWRDDRFVFAIGEDAKTMLLEGLDAVELSMKHSAAIAAWQAADRINRPYIYFGAST